MSAYADFPRDFTERTRANIEGYSGDFDVTNLINNCLGLIIIPKEHLAAELPNYTFSESNSPYQISKTNITLKDKGNYTLKNVVRHIRNGLAHGRIEQRSNNGEITGIRIFDCKNNNAKENFSIGLSIDELKAFAMKLSYDFTDLNNTPIN